MRVKVTKTINLNEVPDFVGAIVTECREKLSLASNNLICSLHDTEDFINRAKNAQETLALVNEKLEDIINISAGWQQANETPPQQEQQIVEEAQIEED
tara:strand:- start:1147 stop:1440 length:294 start_codon:yes stop_codon:yes gene_type:complete